MGTAIMEDKFYMKLIIWHEGGIEMKTFPLSKDFSNKKSKKKADEEKRKNCQSEKNLTKTRASQIVLGGYVRNSQGVIEVAPNSNKRMTCQKGINPIRENCCPILTQNHQFNETESTLTTNPSSSHH